VKSNVRTGVEVHRFSLNYFLTVLLSCFLTVSLSHCLTLVAEAIEGMKFPSMREGDPFLELQVLNRKLIVNQLT